MKSREKILKQTNRTVVPSRLKGPDGVRYLHSFAGVDACQKQIIALGKHWTVGTGGYNNYG